MNYGTALQSDVLEYLRTVRDQDIGGGRAPMKQAQRSEVVTTGRYVAVRLDLGLDNKRLLKLLDEATIHQLIPWDVGKQRPQVYLDRRRVVVEVPLPPAAQEYKVQLSQLTGSNHNGKVCVLGPNERGVTVSLHLSDIIHILIGGETGAGKTYTMRQLARQLANGVNRIVLADGKRGDGLGILNGLPGQIGPIAIDRNATLDALGWVYDEMTSRYDVVAEQRGGRAWVDGEIGAPQHIIVLFDEFQVYRDDSEMMKAVHTLVSMGRSARVHVIAGTQKPTVKMFGKDVGGATRDQFGTRLAHWVQSYQASNAIVGDREPRADYLLPQGDAYVLGNAGGCPLCERVQIAYVPEDDLYRFASGGVPELDAWPAFDTSKLGSEVSVGRPPIEFGNAQIACGVYAAQNGWGRGRLQSLLDDRGVHIAGSEPVDRLLSMGRDIQDELDGITACLKW